MKNADFFFGSAPFDLYRWRDLASTVSQEHFTAQLNRYLKANNNFVEIFHETSHPDFSSLLGAISPQEIGNIKIFARTDQNNAVKATLACDILLVNGVVRVTPQWCAYKEARASEIISSLLVPIHARALQGKTYIIDGSGAIDRLLHGSDFESELQNIFSLSGYPNSYDSKYIKQLKVATEVGSASIPLDDVLNVYFKAMNPTG